MLGSIATIKSSGVTDLAYFKVLSSKNLSDTDFTSEEINFSKYLCLGQPEKALAWSPIPTISLESVGVLFNRATADLTTAAQAKRFLIVMLLKCRDLLNYQLNPLPKLLAFIKTGNIADLRVSDAAKHSFSSIFNHFYLIYPEWVKQVEPVLSTGRLKLPKSYLSTNRKVVHRLDKDLLITVVSSLILFNQEDTKVKATLLGDNLFSVGSLTKVKTSILTHATTGTTKNTLVYDPDFVTDMITKISSEIPATGPVRKYLAKPEK
jgi:hypothetical protein